MNRFCQACSITTIDEVNYLKDRAVCRNYFKKSKKNNSNTLIQKQHSKNDNGSINNRTHLVGHSLSGKTYLTLKILSRIPDRKIFKITKSAREQF